MQTLCGVLETGYDNPLALEFQRALDAVRRPRPERLDVTVERPEPECLIHQMRRALARHLSEHGLETDRADVHVHSDGRDYHEFSVRIPAPAGEIEDAVEAARSAVGLPPIYTLVGPARPEDAADFDEAFPDEAGTPLVAVYAAFRGCLQGDDAL